MTTTGMNPKADWYFNEEEKWREESDKLRAIILSCGLDEALKWGKPLRWPVSV